MQEVKHSSLNPDTDTNGSDPAMRDDEPGVFSESSLVDLIRKDVKELSEVEEVYIPVAGYENSGLAVKYRLPESGKEIDEIDRRVSRQFKDRFSRNLYTAIDTMIILCEGLYVKPNGEGDEWYELDPELMGSPVRFDSRLAEILGASEEVESARNVLKRLFGNNDMKIMVHAEKLARWMSNTKADVTREVWQEMGE